MLALPVPRGMAGFQFPHPQNGDKHHLLRGIQVTSVNTGQNSNWLAAALYLLKPHSSTFLPLKQMFPGLRHLTPKAG